MPVPLQRPARLRRLLRKDPELHDNLATAFDAMLPMALRGEALPWALERLGDLLDAETTSEVLSLLVEEGTDLTKVPQAWAITWAGDLGSGRASVSALVATDGQEIPAPDEVSRTVLARVATTGEPQFSDDAVADAHLADARSVQALELRSVGCVPVGSHGALYLLDPNNAGRFNPRDRARLTALCQLAGGLLALRSSAAPSRKRRARPAMTLDGIIGDSPAMHEVFGAIRAFAPMPWPALVLGESGTGKEVVAKALHRLSPRAGQPFLAVNCGAIPESTAESTLFGHERGAFTGAERRHAGLVERVGKGTLFLDEVGELTPSLQVKLLRLLQEGTYERMGGESTLRFAGRVVAATHRGLDDPETRGAFREDLYYRLAACRIHVPSLDARRIDIPALADFLLQRSLAELPGAPALQLSPGARRALMGRDWPGNVRELENVLRAGIARCWSEQAESIEPQHLLTPGAAAPTAGTAPVLDADLQTLTEKFQRSVVRAALAETDGNRTRAAEALGVSRQWLQRLLSRWDGEP